MKRKKSNTAFLDQLKKTAQQLKKMKPGEVHVLSIHANYGNYQIIIGPENSHQHQREIKIDGTVHHLFISERNISAQPTREQVLQNMKDMVIMRKLHVHFRDQAGDGEHFMDEDGVYAQEYINLAGEMGKQMVANAIRDRQMSLAAYKIVQQDILKALKKDKHKRN